MDGAFTVLLVLVGGVSAAIGESVLPPENVTVSCQNLRVTVSWGYRNLQPQISFEVNIVSSAGGEIRKSTTKLQYDLSPFIWASEKRYMDKFYVAVRAVQGGVWSQLEESKTFSFNQLKTTSFHCELDFPPVDLDVKEFGAMVTFSNPVHFYRELEKANKHYAASFHFSVITDNSSEFSDSCNADQKLCRCDVTFPEGVEKCVTLRGLLYDRHRVRYVSFRKTERICVREVSEFPTLMLAMLLSIVGLVVSVLVIAICKVKAWVIGPPVKPPKPLRDVRHHRNQEKPYHRLPIETMDPAPLIEPCVEPEFTEQGKDLCESTELEPGPEPEPEPVPDPDPDLGYKMDNNSMSESMETESLSIDSEEAEEDEQARSPYDCPHDLQVDLGDGDLATGYTCR